MIGEVLSDVILDFKGVTLWAKTDTDIDRIGDLIDYTYYLVSNIIGQLTAESILLTVKRGRATLTYDFTTAAIDFYLLEGNFYVDLSRLDFTDLDLSSLGLDSESLPSGKIWFKDAVSFLNDEKFRSLADILSLGIFGMDTLLSFAQKDPVIDEALSLERYSDEQFLAKYQITSASIAALVGQISSDAASEVKTKIDDAVTFVEGSYLSVLFNAKTQEVEKLGVNGGVIPDLSTLSEGEQESPFKEATFTMNATLFSTQEEGFEIPSLEDYQEIVRNETQEEA